MKKNITKKITFVGLMTAVIAVLSQIAIPLPSGVPITLQTFAVALTGYMLSYKYGSAAVVTYILLGAVGVPVFSGLKGGAGVLFVVTGGFIFGFLPMAFLCGLSSKMKQIPALLMGLAGLFVCHALGTVQFYFISGEPFIAAFLKVSAPYLIKDIISLIAAYYVFRLMSKRKVFRID